MDIDRERGLKPAAGHDGILAAGGEMGARHSRIPVGSLKIGGIAAERKAHLTNDVLNDPNVDDKEWARREGMVAFAGYPLTVGERATRCFTTRHD